jgi:TP901-1 family phage major tail protein
MAKLAGRKVKLYSGSGVGATLVAGGREDSITINNEAIDVTDKGDDGWRTLLADASVRSVDLSFSGLMDGSTLVALALNANTSALLSEYEIRIEGVGVISGDFHASSVEIGAPHDDAVELSMSLASSGPITFTAS